MSRQIQFAVKRLMDITAAVFGLAACLPLFFVVAIAVKLDSEGPVFFTQERVGRAGKSIRIWKFRTMVHGAEQAGSGVYVDASDPRITRVGQFLRRFSVDELPQLVAVLAGEMSLIGPRPALPYQLEFYSPRNASRLWVRPGITGWSQVNGRNSISWPERLEKDVWYVEHFSLALDICILLRTPVVWLSGQGLYGAREKFFFTGQDDIPSPAGKKS
jgi:lipopolysaccharide/colanic/teichoic acid biosynthesis glycosyltransferase